jgi:hypothetical protein
MYILYVYHIPPLIWSWSISADAAILPWSAPPTPGVPVSAANGHENGIAPFEVPATVEAPLAP